MNAKIETFRDLKAWQRAVDCAVETYELTKIFPKEELYGLTSQLRRAAVSISSNIAEGFGRSTALDKKRYYTMAIGSNDEVQSQLHIAKRLGYIGADQAIPLTEALIVVRKMTGGLHRSAKDA